MSARFRPKYRELTPAEKTLVEQIKTKAAEMEKLYDVALSLHPGRYPALAMTSLEESVMWATKGITS